MSRFVYLLAAFSWLAAGQQYRAFWADAFHGGYKTPEQIDALVEHLASARANAVIIQARRRGDAYFRRGLEPFAPDDAVPPGFDPLEDLIRKARARGIEVHAWFVVYPSWLSGSMPPDPNHVWNRHGPEAAGRENWVNYSSAGRAGLGLDPGHPDVLPYLLEVFLEPLKHYDLDGVHLDYIRYPEDADYGYNPAAIERFNRFAGRGGAPVRTDPAWQEWRRAQVSALVRQFYLRVQEFRPAVKISAATITWGNGPLNDGEYRQKDAYSRVYQDWRGWLEEGILDFAVPMNYFDETRFAGYLDRWTEFQKNGQGRRAIVNGLGVYLNTIPATLSQMQRVLAPSPETGNRVWGVSFYSYSATARDVPQNPNPDFYRAVAEFFGEAVQVPELPWKTRPERGYLLGRLEAESGPEWLRDGATISIERESGERVALVRSDVTGFFGLAEAPPGRYRARVLGAVPSSTPSEVIQLEAGKTGRLRLRLAQDEIQAALPEWKTPRSPQAAPGDIVWLDGRNLAARYEAATAVPLPATLGQAVVLANGTPVPLFEAAPEFVLVQLPYQAAERWELVLRRPGLESAPLVLETVPAAPRITGIRPVPGALEIYASGLGAVEPPLAAGLGANAEEPFPRCVQPVKVRITTAEGEVTLDPAYAGLTPYLPGRYQVNVLLPEGMRPQTVRLIVGGIESAAAVL